ncbi:MAG TPA: S9 family peptidase, partial [Vicinamibacterales bacterium]
MKSTTAYAAILFCAAAALAQTAPVAAGRTAPTVDQILSLKRVGSPELSPDGRTVAYTVRQTNWDDNTYDTQIWLADVGSGATRQLTAGKKSSQSPAWSPDGSRIAFVSDRTDKRQIYLIDPRGGEAEPLTSLDDGIDRFAWAPDGKTIAYTATDPKSAAAKDRDKKYGEFLVVEQDYRMTQLYVIDVTSRVTRTLTSGGAFTVGDFSWSPDSRSLAFDHRANPALANGSSADISIVTVADASVRKLVTQDGPDTNPVWSPDGSRIAFQTAMANPAFFYSNSLIAVVPAAGGTPTVLSSGFDEDPSIVAWKPNGLFFAAAARTYSYLYRLDPESKTVTKVTLIDQTVDSGFSLSKDGQAYACLRADAKAVSDVYAVSGLSRAATEKKLTDMNAQIADWAAGTVEVVSWKSQDGAAIEGVLHKPADFDPGRKYPLLVVIHGGPTGVSRAIPYTSTIYPIDVWVPRGVLVLEPNYRGSAGYGEKFRALNVRNLGIGDAWDVLSGIDALVAKGMVDPARVGAMGWSQGGYISAYLTTHDAARFKAISVGAGISDWMTYYVNTDITPFTRQYLKATPWDDPA